MRPKINLHLPFCHFQSALPRPPVPPLAATFRRLREYAAVLAEVDTIPLAPSFASELARFEQTAAERLQPRLEAISEASENWVGGGWVSEALNKCEKGEKAN
jgi:hypothetical protein